MSTRVPTIIPQSSYIPHPITRLWLCIECHIHAFTTQFNRFSILTYYCWYRVTFPEYPCPGSSIWLIRSLCDVCICPGFAIACYVDSDNIPSSAFEINIKMYSVSFYVRSGQNVHEINAIIKSVWKDTHQPRPNHLPSLTLSGQAPVSCLHHPLMQLYSH